VTELREGGKELRGGVKKRAKDKERVKGLEIAFRKGDEKKPAKQN